MPQNFVSRFNNLLAVKGRGGIEYTAGPNIDISDYIISGRDWTSDINAAIKGVKGSSFDATTAWVDSQGYLTEHQDVSNLPYVQNSALEFSPQNLISGISGTGFYATSADGAFLAETANFAYHSESADTAGYAESAGTTDSANYALTAFFANSATSSLMAETAIYAYTADKADDLTNWTYTDSAMTGIKGYNGTAFISQDLQYWDYTDSAHTAIKGYNGTAFNSIDANCPWISGNKVISPTQETYAGQEFQVISSFDFSGDKNHFISLKGMVLKFPSTAHIASALYEKFDTTAFNNFITNGFNPNMNELHGATAYLSAFVNTGCVHNSALDYTEDEKISGISGIPLVGNGGGAAIWISGNKYIGPEVLLNFGDAVQYISSFTVSGDHNHAIALKGSQFKLPSTAHIQSALDEKLPISSFSSYTANADSRMDGIFQLANSAYTTAVNNFYNKADISAISSWSGDINYISGEFAEYTANAEYTAGENIDITNHVVSGKDWLPTIESAVSSKLDSDTFTAYTANADVAEYTAGANIDITNHVVSGKDWLPTIESGLSGKLDSTATANFVTSGDVTGTAQYALTTAGWTEVTGGSETGGYELSAGEGISITDYPEDQKTVISVTGGNYNAKQLKNSLIGGDPQPPILMAIADLTTATPQEITSMPYISANAQGILASYGETSPSAILTGNGLTVQYMTGTSSQMLTYVQSDGIYFTRGTGSTATNWSLTGSIQKREMEFDSTTSAVTAIAGSAVGKAYTGGANIIITNHVVSGKDWTDTITAASAYAASQATGKEYTGIAPIVVNNTEDKISAQTTELIAGNGIEFVTAATSTTINVTGGQSVSNVAVYTDSNLPNSTQLDADIAAGKAICIIYGGRNYWYDRYSSDYYFYAAAAYSNFLYYLFYRPSNNNWYTGQRVMATQTWVDTNYLPDSAVELNGSNQVTAIDGHALAGGGGASVHYYIDTPNEHTSADIELTIQASATIGGRYDRWLMNSGNFIGALIPSADSVDDAGKVLTVTAGSPRWQSLPETPSGALGIKVLAVATSAAATAGDADTLYIVTGS